MYFNNKVNILNPDLIGWFAIGLSKDLAPLKKITGVLANKNYLLYRDEKGKLIFNGKKNIVIEQNDFIYVWNHPLGNAPSWSVPNLSENGWMRFRHHTLTAKTHPQEVYENSVDMAHFSPIHGFCEIGVLKYPEFTGHQMVVAYELKRKHPIPFIKKKVGPNFEFQLNGPGVAHTHINIDDFGMKVRMFTLTTPTTTGKVEIRIGVSINKDIKNPIVKFLLPIIAPLITKNVIYDFCQDMEIWENKTYLPEPLLVNGDGPIVLFRRWFKQFYNLDKEVIL